MRVPRQLYACLEMMIMLMEKNPRTTIIYIPHGMSESTEYCFIIPGSMGYRQCNGHHGTLFEQTTSLLQCSETCDSEWNIAVLLTKSHVYYYLYI